MDTFIKHADHARVVGDLNTIIDKQSKVIADLNTQLAGKVAEGNIKSAHIERQTKEILEQRDMLRRGQIARCEVIADLYAKLSASFDNNHANMVVLTDYRRRCAELVNKLHAVEAQLAALQKKYNEDSKNRHWVAEVDRMRMTLNFEKQAHAKLQGQYDSLNKKATEQAKLLAMLRGVMNDRVKESVRLRSKISEVLA